MFVVQLNQLVHLLSIKIGLKRQAHSSRCLKYDTNGAAGMRGDFC